MSEEPPPPGFEISEITRDLHFPDEVTAIVTIHGLDEQSSSGKVSVTAILPHDPDRTLSSYEEAFRAEAVRRLREAAEFLDGTNYPEAIERQKAVTAYTDGTFDRALSDLGNDEP